MGIILENSEPTKCVIVIANHLSLGLMVNTASVLAVSLGRQLDSMVGPDVLDFSGTAHAGLTSTPLPILTAKAPDIKELRDRAEGMEDLTVIDFSDVAQEERNYGSYTERMSRTSSEDLSYLGIALYGPKKSVNRLTGNLPLLREGTLNKQPSPDHDDGAPKH
jgi:hypothetical protein